MHTIFKFINGLNRWIRNFVWIRDVNKVGLVIIKWNFGGSSKHDGGLQVLNLQVKNKAYLLRLAWDFAYTNMPWSNIIVSSSHSSFIWPDINEYYDIVLHNNFWTVESGDQINLWNDLCYFFKCIYFITGVPCLERISLTSTIVDCWNDSGWYLSPNNCRHPYIHYKSFGALGLVCDILN